MNLFIPKIREKNRLFEKIKDWKKLRSNKKYINESKKTESIHTSSVNRTSHPDGIELEERINNCISPKFLQIDTKLSALEGKLSKLSEIEGKLSKLSEIEGKLSKLDKLERKFSRFEGKLEIILESIQKQSSGFSITKQ